MSTQLDEIEIDNVYLEIYGKPKILEIVSNANLKFSIQNDYKKLLVEGMI